MLIWIIVLAATGSLKAVKTDAPSPVAKKINLNPITGEQTAQIDHGARDTLSSTTPWPSSWSPLSSSWPTSSSTYSTDSKVSIVIFKTSTPMHIDMGDGLSSSKHPYPTLAGTMSPSENSSQGDATESGGGWITITVDTYVTSAERPAEPLRESDLNPTLPADVSMVTSNHVTTNGRTSAASARSVATNGCTWVVGTSMPLIALVVLAAIGFAI